MWSEQHSRILFPAWGLLLFVTDLVHSCPVEPFERMITLLRRTTAPLYPLTLVLVASFANAACTISKLPRTCTYHIQSWTKYQMLSSCVHCAVLIQELLLLQYCYNRFICKYLKNLLYILVVLGPPSKINYIHTD